jgi:hypothetical protein
MRHVMHEIELKRNELNKLIEIKGTLDKDVLRVSQELDD